jgi:ketosteroid isomerase-like protein
VQRRTDARRAVGFGIKTIFDVEDILQIADLAVIGSKVIDIVQREGVDNAIRLLAELVDPSLSATATVERFVAGIATRDLEEATGCLGADATAFVPVGDHPLRLDGRDAITALLRDHFGSHPDPQDLHLEDGHIRLDGDHAVVSGHLRGGDASLGQRTLVMRRWLIAHLHGSSAG